MMDHLANGPAFGPIRRVQLFLVQSGHRGAHASRSRRYLVDQALAVVVGKRSGKLKRANGVTQIHFRLQGCVTVSSALNRHHANSLRYKSSSAYSRALFYKLIFNRDNHD